MEPRPNYAKQLSAVLAGLSGTRPRLALHACCGPCSSAVLEQLAAHFEITILYYNPNIWPGAEYRRRADELARLLAQLALPGVRLVEDEYDPGAVHKPYGTHIKNQPFGQINVDDLSEFPGNIA